jgi:hypothetical protein
LRVTVVRSEEQVTEEGKIRKPRERGMSSVESRYEATASEDRKLYMFCIFGM